MSLARRTLDKMSDLAYIGTSSGRGLSPRIWRNCPIEYYKSNVEQGMFWMDDFKGGYNQATNTAITKLEGAVYGFTENTTNSLITTSVTDDDGILVLGADDDGKGTTVLALCGSGAGGMIELPATKKFWYETRLAVNMVTDAKISFFVGICDKALGTAAGIVAAAGTGINDINCVGFSVLEADSNMIDCIWKNKGVTQVTTGNDAAAIVINTYTKLGMYGDGYSVTFTKDGVPIYTTPSTTHAGTGFPNVAGENMCLALALMSGHSDGCAMSVDWLAFAQEV